MKAAEFLNTKTAAYAGVAVVGVVVLWWVARKASAAVGDAAAVVGVAVNPLNPNNLANRVVTSVGTTVSGDSNWTFGGWLYDVTHPTYDPNAPYVPPQGQPTSWFDAVKLGGK